MIKYERIWELLLVFFFFLDAEDNFHILDISFSISGKKNMDQNTQFGIK